MHKVRKIKRLHNREGMALVMTLLAVSFLVAITVQLATSVNWQMQGAGNLRDSVQLDAISRSGLSLVRAALLADLKDNKDVDTPHDSWNKLTGEDAPSLFGPEALDLKVTDLSGLLQVNALVPDEKDKAEFKKMQDKQVRLWERFLLSGKFAVDDQSEADKIIDALIDWIDEDDTERNDSDAESGYYLSLSPSYAARNAPVSYSDELLLIRGMTKELFYGNDGYSALKDYVTVAGRDGIININAAPVEVLMALDPNGDMSEDTAKDLVDFAQNEDNMPVLSNPSWYQQVNGGLDLSREGLISVKSRYFKVSVVARHNTMARSGTGILERVNDKGEQRLWYWEVR